MYLSSISYSVENIGSLFGKLTNEFHDAKVKIGSCVGALKKLESDITFYLTEENFEAAEAVILQLIEEAKSGSKVVVAIMDDAKMVDMKHGSSKHNNDDVTNRISEEFAYVIFHGGNLLEEVRAKGVNA